MVFLFWDAYYHVANDFGCFFESYKTNSNTQTSQECSELT